jgi:thioredoxin reductase (NADPH)
MKTLVIAKSLGGQAALANEVENWPGIGSISGFDLMNNFKAQADKLGLEFNFNEVLGISKSGNDFVVKTNKDEFMAKSVILAFGLTPRDLGVPGEAELKGRGVTYCAICDGPLYKGKTVAVVGNGNSAMESAQYMSKLAKQVYLLSNSDKFNADPLLIEEAQKMENIEMTCFSQIKEIKGEGKVESIVVIDTRDEKQTREIKLDGVFVEAGHQAKTSWLKGTVDLNEKGEIITNRDCETSSPGIFAAGDCTDTTYKQIVIAAGEGAKAALQAYKYVAAKSGGYLKPDWGKCKTVSGGDTDVRA